MTVGQVANLIGKSRWGVHHMIRHGRLKAAKKRVGTRWYYEVCPASVRRYQRSKA